MKKQILFAGLAITILTFAILACNIPGSVSAPSTGEQPTISSNPQSNNPVVTEPCANPLIPIKAGATWNYALTGSISDTFTRSIVSVDSSGFSEKDVFSTGTVREGKWNCDNGNLITLDPNGGTTASVSFNGASADFQTTSLSGVTLPATVNTGDTWSQSVTIEGVTNVNDISANMKNEFTISCKAGPTESITVQAGTFNAVQITCQTNMNITITMNGSPLPATPLSVNSVTWYAPGVGLIKSTNSSAESGDSTIELLSYTIP